MVRTHTLVEYRLKEYELEQALRRLKKEQEGLDYKLDVEFYLQLEALTKDYGYTLNQVFELLLARYERESTGLGIDADGLQARTNAKLLEMIQRLEALSPGLPDKHTASVTTDAENREFYESGSGRSDGDERPLVASVESEYRVREKLND
ncbi:hypothetical protein QMK56_10350 [Pseudomonas protegens]|uniref:hypothetical protein n=1 Tax=Pseudomonas protegens TaxID=380021 RepID=UPI002A3600C2|nr:hypothetical protein [Pseudomonas protegens]MDX9681895.1 hypothetical protein [Pseudomonas protegens]